MTTATREPARSHPGPLPDVLPDPEDDWAELRRADMRQRLVTAGVPLIEEPGADAEGQLLPARDILSDIAFEIEVYLRGLSVAQLVCLAYGHRWPELVPGIRVPKALRVVPHPEYRGSFLLRENCTRKVSVGAVSHCGTVRQSLTLPGEVRGLLDRKHGRSYSYDDADWEIRPAGSRLTRIDFFNEIMRRMNRELFADLITEAESQ